MYAGRLMPTGRDVFLARLLCKAETGPSAMVQSATRCRKAQPADEKMHQRHYPTETDWLMLTTVQRYSNRWNYRKGM
jgi:hypothetical protein